MIHMLYDVYVRLSPAFSLFSPSKLKSFSLDHPSAFWDRRRYYETYVRYVVLFVFLIFPSRFGSSKKLHPDREDFSLTLPFKMIAL